MRPRWRMASAAALDRRVLDELEHDAAQLRFRQRAAAFGVHKFRFFGRDTFTAILSGQKLDPNAAPPQPAGWQKVFDALTWAFPNRYEKLLVVPDFAQVLGGLALFMVWGAACVAIASFIVSRRDV